MSLLDRIICIAACIGWLILFTGAILMQDNRTVLFIGVAIMMCAALTSIITDLFKGVG